MLGKCMHSDATLLLAKLHKKNVPPNCAAILIFGSEKNVVFCKIESTKYLVS